MTESHDYSKGAIVWPIADGQSISVQDAYETLFNICEAELFCTGYEKDGNSVAETLNISYDFNDNVFAFSPLKKLIEDNLSDVSDYKSEIRFVECEYEGLWTEETAAAYHKLDMLRVRLLRAFADWEANDFKMTPQQLREIPLPSYASLGAECRTKQQSDGHGPGQ